MPTNQKNKREETNNGNGGTNMAKQRDTHNPRKKRALRICSCVFALYLLTGCTSSPGPAQTSNEWPESSSSVQASSSKESVSLSSSEEDKRAAASTASSIKNNYSGAPELNENWMPYRPEEYLAPELPKLTAEELAREDEPVAQEVWENLHTASTYIVIPNKLKSPPELDLPLDEWARRCLKKQNDEITYGELWRLNNANEELFLGFNIPNEYPEALKNLKSIKSIRMIPYFDNNPFDSATDLSNLVAMTWLEELSIEGGNRHEYFRFPTELTKLTHLKKLEMIQCYITELPDIFDAFPELEVLNLKWNYIEKLPPSVYRCKNLKILTLIETNYSIVSHNIAQLQLLEELYLPCPINQLPDEICELSNLKVLYFSFPRYVRGEPYVEDDKIIHSLPQKIGDLKKLEVLDINYNFPITELPESITDCESLRILKAPCVIKAPEDMDKLKNLEESLIGDDWWTSYEQY